MFKKLLQKYIHQPLKAKIIKHLKGLIEEQLHQIWRKQIEVYVIVLILILAAFLLDFFLKISFLNLPLCMSIVYIATSIYFMYRGVVNLKIAYRISREDWFQIKDLSNIKYFISQYVIHKYKVIRYIHNNTNHKKILGLHLNNLIPSVEELVNELYEQYKKQLLSFVLFTLLASVFSKFLMQYLMHN